MEPKPPGVAPLPAVRESGRRLRAGFFDFACCEGCQLTVLQLEERLLDLLDIMEFVEWRELSSRTADRFDVAFCEGSIASEADRRRLAHIRERSEILVALGSCAAIACPNDLVRRWDFRRALETVYGDAAEHIDAVPPQPVAAVVCADYTVLGCPLSLPEFEAVLKAILTGRKYRAANDPVCVECKRNDYLCVLEKGRLCLGPLTRCGCNAACTACGDVCHGCRGLVDDANPEALLRVFGREDLHPIMAAAVRRNPLRTAELREKIALYNRLEPRGQ